MKDAIKNPQALFMKFVHHAATARMKKRKSQQAFLGKFAAQPQRAAAANIAEPLALAEFQEAVEVAIRSLDETYRRVVEMRFKGMSFKEIATKLGIPEATARWRYHEALIKIKVMLQDRGFGPNADETDSLSSQ